MNDDDKTNKKLGEFENELNALCAKYGAKAYLDWWGKSLAVWEVRFEPKEMPNRAVETSC